MISVEDQHTLTAAEMTFLLKLELESFRISRTTTASPQYDLEDIAGYVVESDLPESSTLRLAATAYLDAEKNLNTILNDAGYQWW
jgi:hypothetical protein